jgi:hypothetical protein
MNPASSYLPKILGLAVAASALWAILSLPPGLNQRLHTPPVLEHGLSALSAHQGHHPGAYKASWDEVFARWTR